MLNVLKEFSVSTTKRYELVDITEMVEDFVGESGVKEGIVYIFVPHSTAGVVLTENESGLLRDWENFSEKLTSGLDFYHNQIDNNADSHLLSGLVGQGKFLLIHEGRLIRGTWQQVFLFEFDGPRKRKIILKVVKQD